MKACVCLVPQGTSSIWLPPGLWLASNESITPKPFEFHTVSRGNELVFGPIRRQDYWCNFRHARQRIKSSFKLQIFRTDVRNHSGAHGQDPTCSGAREHQQGDPWER